jgi:predicted DCC family thiol-disulfide oxidoreductase YuxK
VDSGHPIVFYDGECGLCNARVQHILRNDRRGLFRFAPLQGGLAAQVLPRHGRDPRDLDSMYVALEAGEPGERLLMKSAAAAYIARHTGGFDKLLAAIAGVFPRALQDWGYDLIAKNRLKLGPKNPACQLPTPELRARFLD